MTDERDVLEVDVLFVGAGVASLSCAYALKRRIAEYNEKAGEDRKIASPVIAVLEKGAELGEHALSGAVLEPRSLRELIPDFKERGAPIDSAVTSDAFYFLTKGTGFKLPFAPPGMGHAGNLIVSLSKFTRWLGSLVADEEVDIFTGFPARELLFEGGAVSGVRTADKGIDKEGKKKSNFTPGIDIKAKVTVLGEGNYGTLTQRLIAEKDLALDKEHQIYATAVKEVWELVPERHSLGRVIHTFGWPLPLDTFGGCFLYFGADRLLYMGCIVGLDYKDPRLDPHKKLQLFKRHPLIRKIIEGGKLIAYGGKTIPEGGYCAVPKTHCGGCLIVGDGGGFLDNLKLKGLHCAIESGMLAAETICEALRKDNFSEAALGLFEHRLHASKLWKDLRRGRNFRQAFSRHMIPGMIDVGFQTVTGGASLNPFRHPPEDRECLRRLDGASSAQRGAGAEKIEYDEKYTFDKTTSVYYSGTQHEENQPSHVIITDPALCAGRCREEYGNPCQYFCPGKVFSIEEDENGKIFVELTPSNCLHCKTCAIKDPYGIIEWTPPEEGGPKYTTM